jgi:superfamily II DNA or RNA helicase
MALFERQRSRLESFLRGQAVQSVVDAGIDSALQGRVVEYGRVGSAIEGIVTEASPVLPAKSTKLDLQRDGTVIPSCTCTDLSRAAPLDSDTSAIESLGATKGHWCEHAVALLWRCNDAGFLNADGDVAISDQVTEHVDRNSPEQVAIALGEVVRLASMAQGSASNRIFLPAVTSELDLSSDKLGVKLFFDGELQKPSPVRFQSARVLDNVILSTLEERGVWDEDTGQWFVAASSDIELLLGLLREYEGATFKRGKTIVEFAAEQLEAQIVIEWTSQGAELSLFWVVPGGAKVARQAELIGTGPYWTVVRGKLYKLSNLASKAATIFGRVSEMHIPRSGVGFLLETLTSLGGVLNEVPGATASSTAVHGVEKFLTVKNPTEQPHAERATPRVTLVLERVEHGDSYVGFRLDLVATLEFEYPAAPESESIVYLPHREAEEGARQLLRERGFTSDDQRVGLQRSGQQRFTIHGDQALDTLSHGVRAFPTEWNIVGLDAAARGVRFADLALNISVSAVSDKDGGSGSPSWFDCHVSLLQNNANVPLASLFRNVRTDEDRWVRLDSGAFAKIPGGGVNALKSTLGLLDPNFRLSNSIRARVTAAQALSLNSLHETGVAVSTDGKLRALARRFAEFSEIKEVKPTKKFSGKLRIYQEEGLQWLNFLHDFEFGGILADEMGLGKTVQTLAFLQRIKTDNKGKRLPTLVVCPTSVMMNWMYEATKFTPDLKVSLLHGPGRRALFRSLSQFDLVITSYALLRLDRLELERGSFDYVVLDEAQNIKNPDAAVTKAAKALKCQRRLALTGTPTENRPMELWSIMDFLMPGYLGSAEFFRSYVERPILEGQGAVEITQFLRNKTKPFLLRRAKAEVEKQLPPKIESEIHVEMSSSQARLYNQVLEEVRPKVLDAVERQGMGGASVSILAALLRLRQVCNHPNSIDALKTAPGYESGKFNALKEMLPDIIDGGGKVLLFAQFREMLAIIRRWCDEVGIPYCYLDGETRDRQSQIDQFNNDKEIKVFLISLKAGGTGLNLTAADTVIIYDPWWNPAVESQAVDRAHRIGQRKTVNVYRMVTESSIEQKIMELKERKSKLIETLVNENSLSPRALSKSDLEMLLAPMPTALAGAAIGDARSIT